MATHRSSLCTEHLRCRWRQTGGSGGGGHRSAPDLLQIRTYLLDLCHIIRPHMETVNEEAEKAAEACSSHHRRGAPSGWDRPYPIHFYIILPVLVLLER